MKLKIFKFSKNSKVVKNNKTIYLVIACFASLTMYSQKNKEAKADNAYEKFAYVDAIQTYERVVKKGYKSQDLLQKLGNAYYFKADLVKAAKWYGELFALSQYVEPEYYYRYAQSLKAVKDYTKADLMLVKFNELKETDLRSRLAKNQTDYLTRIKNNSDRYVIENAGINTKYSEFGSAFFNNKIVFTSSRDTGSFSNKRHSWTGEGFTNLYKADIISEGSLSNVGNICSDINSRVNESTPVFTKDGKKVYFTRNNFIDGKIGRDSKRTSLLKLYSANLEGEKWTNVKELPFNSNNYNVAHPALSADEQTLFFASDMPGSLGQSDLYKIAINTDGSFGSPTNLGTTINTEGRETFPMVSENGELYFASDGHPGLGGLDIFVSKVSNEGKFSQVINVGEPVNSSFDDFGFLINDKTRYGYFTSNRDGGKGGDDIYKFKELKKLDTKCEQTLNGITTDAITKDAVSNAKITLSDTNFKVIKVIVTTADGKFDFGTVDCNKKYYIKAEKQFYSTIENATIIPNESGLTFISLAISKSSSNIGIGKNLADKDALDIKQIYFDLNKFDIRPDAETELAKILEVLQTYPAMEIDIRSHTDSRNTAKYNLLLSDKRAKATADWLVLKGIDRKRLSAKGYGESQLINSCSDGINCTEDEHRINRRSEFIIKKM
jgi:outer membrane protein OmpA-like peptidoglycan-associated protein